MKSLLESGAILMVRFPFVEGKGYKWRPALLLSNRAFHKTYGLCWVMMITGSKSPWPGDIAIPLLEETGLGTASVLRAAKIATVSLDAVTVIGRLPAATHTKALRFVRAQIA